MELLASYNYGYVEVAEFAQTAVNLLLQHILVWGSLEIQTAVVVEDKMMTGAADVLELEEECLNELEAPVVGVEDQRITVDAVVLVEGQGLNEVGVKLIMYLTSFFYCFYQQQSVC